ncbi:MAG: hypothetical protein ACREDL_01590, partial [Bradyrhizobium sp.]
RARTGGEAEPAMELCTSTASLSFSDGAVFVNLLEQREDARRARRKNDSMHPNLGEHFSGHSRSQLPPLFWVIELSKCLSMRTKWLARRADRYAVRCRARIAPVKRRLMAT